MLQLRTISCMDKIFLDEPLRAREQTAFSGFQNECISFQLAFCGDSTDHLTSVTIKSDNPLNDCVRLRSVHSVPVRLPTLPDADDNYLRKTPGLYPDLLRDRRTDDSAGDLRVLSGQWQCFWIDIEPCGRYTAGDYPLTLTLLNSVTQEPVGTACVTVTLLPGFLPAQKLRRTGWFHSDCLANYYRVPVFSEEYWRIVENFVRTAAHRGYNMLLTPLFTPPLDTAVGGERTTVQLVDVTVENGQYTFGFDKLHRWVRMAQKCGMQYFEMSHLFTQWGAKHAPKIMATKNGQYQRIFGWETAAAGEDYAAFLRVFLPALMKEVQALGIENCTVFHISDEPRLSMLEDYKAARALVAPYVENCVIMDALSNYEFYESGVVTCPIPALNHLHPFLENKVPNLWTYYCVSQYKDVPNQFISMSSARVRMLGVLLYRYQIAGFLHWGYNFYNSFWSAHPIDPYACTDADTRFPGGDPFKVYPGEDGIPEESIRLVVLHQAMQDLRALDWLETLIGREKTLELLLSCAEGPLTLEEYPRDSTFFTRLCCPAPTFCPIKFTAA